MNNIDKIIGNENSAIIKDSEIKSEFDLKQKKTFQEYDFENIWNIDEGKSYPVLKAINRTEPKAQLIGAEIVFVPLKNLIVFGSGDPNTPDGIILLLRFSDGKIRFYTVKENNYEYIVGEFDIEHYGSVTVYRTGFLIDEIVVNGQFELKYIYLSLPDFLGDKL